MAILVHGPSGHPELPAPWQPDGFNWDWPRELDSWTWPGAEGSTVGVRVFARGCEAMTLSLDGVDLAVASGEYEPGSIVLNVGRILRKVRDHGGQTTRHGFQRSHRGGFALRRDRRIAIEVRVSKLVSQGGGI